MNPISAMLLVKNDRHAIETIGDLAAHCCEVLVGWTANDALTEAELLASGATRVLEIPGPLMDWAAARNRVMEFASQPWCLWADSDDRVDLARLEEGLALLADAPLARLLCPYWYLMAEGKPTHVQVRERVWRNDGRFTWKRRCHETLVAKDGRYGDHEPRCDFLIWKHHRQEQPESLGHQLEMLRLEEREHPGDSWVQQTIGLTLYRMLRREEAIPYLERAVAESGDAGDKAMTMLTLARAEADVAYTARGDADFTKAERWAREALALLPGAFESHYVLALMLSMRVALRGDKECAAEALEEYRAARACPHMDHRLGVSLRERESEMPVNESGLLSLMGDTAGALEAIERSAELTPRLRVVKRQLAAAVEMDLMSETAPALPLSPATREQYDIVFACGRSWTPWNPAIVDEHGFGGSETAVVEMARRLRAAGHRVRVFCSSGGSGIYDGVEYRDMDSMREGERVGCDVLIAWRDAAQLEFADARVRLAWAHDVELVRMTPKRALYADRVLALSEWHKRNLTRAHGLDFSRVVVTRNGIDLGRFVDSGAARDPHRIVWSSSLDRGLQVLLDVWPEIRARAPDVTLECFYGADTWEAVAEQSKNEQQRYAVKGLLRRLAKTPGVTYHGKVDQKTLAREMLGSGVWVGSLWFSETSNISAMEAQAAGLRMIAGARAANLETIGERGTLLAGDWLSDGFQARLVDDIVAAMTEPESAREWRREKLQAYARAEFGWEGVVEQWEGMFGELMAESEGGVMPAYGGRK